MGKMREEISRQVTLYLDLIALFGMANGTGVSLQGPSDSASC
jgi:hypothetical protein